jgi:hypothetical protein
LSEVLQKYLPEHAVTHCFELIKDNHVHLKIVNERITRHGDYRKDAHGYHLITGRFDVMEFNKIMSLQGDVPDIQKKNPTLLYLPNSLD